MSKVSDHFELWEVERSSMAARFGITNKLPVEYFENARNIADNILEPLRKQFGPFSPTSWFRSRILNNAVNGSLHSQHLTACAVDFVRFGDCNLKYIYRWISEKLSYDQLILENFINSKNGKDAWIHVSFVSKDENRKESRVC